MNWTTRIGAWLLGVALIFGVGVGVGWKFFRPKPLAAVETPQAAARQNDGSLILERAPDANAKPAQTIPKGAKVERIERIVVQPSTASAATAPTSGPAQPAAAIPALPHTVEVDLTLLKMPDESRRVVASSPDGTVVGGIDIPVENQSLPKSYLWAAGGSYNPTDKTYGVWIDRRLWRVVLGAEINQVKGTPATWQAASTGTTYAASIRVGFTF